MQSISTRADLRGFVSSHRRAGRTVGFVPTMGALHHGHMALVERCRAENDVTIVSIFVNPTQFGPNEDFDAYPRRIDHDLELCRSHGVDAVFHPGMQEMYPEPLRTVVEVAELSSILIGEQRPGHFRGVATVVAKLLNIVEPDRAYFGEKDFQQLAVVRRMAFDLSMRATIVGVPTVREADGLAASSRNLRLTPAERRVAPVVHQAMLDAKRLFETGERDAATLLSAVRARAASEPSIALLSCDLCDSATLGALRRVADGPAVLLVTARLGSVVLIDQFELKPDLATGGPAA
ncbi:pantoate--beta-alanine ligase [Aureimonas flava]|uniref:Pantothenate synthetase n=1 Tax=Aureimonas flava TaxID=2320271 RepID=A0A3A1WNU1_9HYPH|nr:pantoate--beta-alanine ligase [Aureimonas flava]RIY02197.1 pantoate--beta-alanine ligase [Aureimonas flava]